MRVPFIIAASLAFVASTQVGFAATFACESVTFCSCPTSDGCSEIGAYLSDEPKLVCKDYKKSFSLTASRRSVRLAGETLQLTLREVRPYFSDMDWYQAGKSDRRGLVNLSFDNESQTPQFELREMAKGHSNGFVWKLSGSCEVKG